MISNNLKALGVHFVIVVIALFLQWVVSTQMLLSSRIPYFLANNFPYFFCCELKICLRLASL
jgi:hypothetical protein